MLIYLADLRYTTISLSPDTMPLGIGFLAAYAKKVLGEGVEFKLFAYAEHLMEELRQTRPDVLGVTNYCWSYALHTRMLQYARGLYPDILTVMGGPNIALDQAGREDRLKQTTGLDIYVIDEGEEAFTGLLERYDDAGLDKMRLFQEALPSSVFADPAGGQVVFGAPVPRRRELNEIPSPYLTGLMDPFFDGALCPLVQTTRGCPFTCTFCVEGVSYMTKVNRFSLDRVKEELEYIAPRAGVGSSLMISDSNFGMLPGDIEVATAIHAMQERYNWPKYIWATTGKNKKEAILSAIDVLDGTMRMTNSVQSMNQDVLTSIKRSNIKLETYASLQKEVQARGRQSYSEVIIALPGETLESFMQGICQLLDVGAQQVTCYQLMLLDGTELNDRQTRERYGFKTKYRVLPRSFGVYDGHPVFEVEEIVVETDTMSFEDYLECRKLQLILDVFHREGFFQEVLAYLSCNDVAISSFIMDLLGHIDEAPADVQALFSDYLGEARTELFDSPEEARRILSEKYQMVLDNEIGGNLVSKYSAIAWFKTLEPVLQYGVSRVKALVSQQSRGTGPTLDELDRELETIRKYHSAKVIDIVNIEPEVTDVIVSLEHDIEAWREEGYQKPLSAYAFNTYGSEIEANGNTDDFGPGREYVFYVPREHGLYLKDKLQMHGTSAQAVGKLISRVVLRDLQRQVRRRTESRA